MKRLPEDVVRAEFLKRLRVKPLAQFRSVSKEFKTLIDSPEFKNTYHVNNPNPEHRLLVRYELDNVQRYTSFVDEGTLPQPRFLLTTPKSLLSLRKPLTLSSDAGLSCFLDSDRGTVVVWSPAVGKYVDIVFPIPPTGYERTIVGFGVCRDTSHPKLVKICVDTTSRKWLVDVFTLSKNLRENKFEGAWKNVFDGSAFENLIDLECAKVSAKGVIYFRGYDNILNYKGRSNLVISFDLKSLNFNKVSLPERLAKARYLQVANVNSSLGLLEYHVKDKSGMHVCDVWTRKDGAFTNIYTIEVKGKPVYGSVLGFRNNGEVVLELDSEIVVYEPKTKKIRGVGINGTQYKFSVTPLMETPYFLDHPEQRLSFGNNNHGAILQGA